MLCSRCKQNQARYTLRYGSARSGERTERLCEECYERFLSAQAEEALAPAVAACPFCGGTVEDYLRVGLVGCAQCYVAFARELSPYVQRFQGSDFHIGKKISSDPKYEAAQTLRELTAKRENALKRGDASLALKLGRKADELKLLLFGDDEEE